MNSATGHPSGHEIRVAVTVNGRTREAVVPSRTTLADLLRDRFRLTGTHLGCEHGVCGACTVFLDGKTVRSCLVLAAQVDGREVTTVEGLEERPATEQLRQGFSRHHGLQCGFCTPGMLVTATELVETEPDLTEETVREVMSGNVCRCTGYQGIVRAVLEAAQQAGITATTSVPADGNAYTTQPQNEQETP